MKKRKGRQAIAVLLGGIMLCSLSMGAVSTPVHAQEAEEEAQAAQDTGGGYNEAPALLDAAEDQGDGSGLLEQDLPQDEAEAGGPEIPAVLPQEEEDAGEADLPEQEGSDAGSEESIVEESLQEEATDGASMRRARAASGTHTITAPVEINIDNDQSGSNYENVLDQKDTLPDCGTAHKGTDQECVFTYDAPVTVNIRDSKIGKFHMIRSDRHDSYVFNGPVTINIENSTINDFYGIRFFSLVGATNGNVVENRTEINSTLDINVTGGSVINNFQAPFYKGAYADAATYSKMRNDFTIDGKMTVKVEDSEIGNFRPGLHLSLSQNVTDAVSPSPVFRTGDIDIRVVNSTLRNDSGFLMPGLVNTASSNQYSMNGNVNMAFEGVTFGQASQTTLFGRAYKANSNGGVLRVAGSAAYNANTKSKISIDSKTFTVAFGLCDEVELGGTLHVDAALIQLPGGMKVRVKDTDGDGVITDADIAGFDKNAAGEPVVFSYSYLNGTTDKLLTISGTGADNSPVPGEDLIVSEPLGAGSSYALEKTTREATIQGRDVTLAEWVLKDAADHQVTFETNGGTPIDPNPVIVKAGSRLTEPTCTKTDHTLDGWYKEDTFQTKWDFAADTVTSDMKLYAKWTQDPTPAVEHEVTFVENGGTPINPNSVRVKAGSRLAEPPCTKTDHTLDGWYKEDTFEKKWDFAADTVTSDMKLYARWTKDSTPAVEHQVTFEPNGGISINPNPLTVKTGSKLTEPVCKREGYTLDGWYREDTFQTKWDFATDTVTSDVQLYAKWPKDPEEPTVPEEPEDPKEPVVPEGPEEPTGPTISTDPAGIEPPVEPVQPIIIERAKGTPAPATGDSSGCVAWLGLLIGSGCVTGILRGRKKMS